MATSLETVADSTITIASRSVDALALARSFVINDDRSRIEAARFLKILKALQSEVKKDREDERVAAKATLDAIMVGRNKHLKPLQDAETIVKQKQIADEDEQIRKRRKAQEEENLRQQAAQAELDRKAQAEAEALAEQQALLAAELEDVGDTDQAQAVLAAPIETPAPQEAPPPDIIPDLRPKVEGQHTTVRWKCRLKKLEDVPRGLLQFDEVAANRWVARIKDDLTRVTSDNGGRPSMDATKVQEIAELPNGTVLTKEILGVETIPGVEIYTEKSRASTAWK